LIDRKLRSVRGAALALLLAFASAAGCKGAPRDGAGANAGSSRMPEAGARADGGGCLDNAACAADEYCAFRPRLCGFSSRPYRKEPGFEQGLLPGTCQKRPAICNDLYSPVCGCDRRVYPNECYAHRAGADLNVNDGCFEQSPRDWISCGERFCNARTQYCEIVLSDVFNPPTDYTCKPLPAACVPDGGTARACDCFPKDTKCLGWCGYIVSGEHGLSGFHLTCRL